MFYADIILGQDRRETLAQKPYFRSRSTQGILFVVSARVLAPVSPSETFTLEKAAMNVCRFSIHIVSLLFIKSFRCVKFFKTQLFKWK